MLITLEEDMILEDYLEEGKIAILKLATTTCPPCKMLAPIFLKLSMLDDFEDVIFITANAIEHQKLMAQFEATAVPTLVYFRGTEVLGKSTGFIPQKALYEFLEKLQNGTENK